MILFCYARIGDSPCFHKRGIWLLRFTFRMSYTWSIYTTLGLYFDRSSLHANPAKMICRRKRSLVEYGSLYEVADLSVR